MNAAAERRISQVRTRMLSTQPFYGRLALRLRPEEAQTGTMSTDGTVLQYCPSFLATETDEDLETIYMEEVLHASLRHPYRVAGMDMPTANRAADEITRRMLVAAGRRIPASANWTPDPRVDEGWSLEQIYSLFMSDRQPDPTGQPQPGQGQEQPGDFTAAPPAPDPSAPPQPGEQPCQVNSESSWEIAAEAAAILERAAGKLPGDVTRALKASRAAQTDWRDELREFTAQHVPAERSWSHPDRRFIAGGLYLPGPVTEGTAAIDIYVDASGSITRAQLDAAAPELLEILQTTHPERMRIMFHDTHVSRTDVYTPDDPAISLECRAGGGTLFQPVLDEAAEDPPACGIWFTDLDCGDRPQEPNYPILWIVPPHRVHRRPPFPGRVIALPVDRR